MQSSSWQTIKAMAFLLATACGQYNAVSGSMVRENAPAPAAPPASASKPAGPVTALVSAKEQPRSVFGPVIATKSSAGNCNGIVLGRTSVVLPSHCVDGNSVTFPNHVDVETVKMDRLDSGVPGVEALVSVTIRVPPAVPVTPIDATKIVRPEIMASAHKLNLVYDFGGAQRELPCFVVTYDLRAAIGYHCQTNPGHSGSLVLDKNGSPIAVHLARRDGLGYGLLLATVFSRPTSNLSVFGELK